MPHRAFGLKGPIRGLAYALLWRCANVMQRATNACLIVAAALQRPEDLEAANEAHWRSLSSDDEDGGLETWERRLYDRVLRPSDRVLLAGCGTGRDLVALVERGWDVTGLDHSSEIVGLAREALARRGLTARVIDSFIEAAELDARYDVVVLSGGTYSYVQGSARRVAMLGRLANHLSPGGRFVLTYGSATPRSPLAAWLTGAVARAARAGWRPERGDSFTHSYLVPRCLKYEHLFAPGEVARECAGAGLRVSEENVGSVGSEVPWLIATR
jgi:SAM-dependent methyltransferase